MILWLLPLLFFLSPGLAHAQGTATVNANVVSLVSLANSTFVTDKSEVVADGTAIGTLTGTIRDSSNQGLIGRLVTITSSRGNTDLIRCYAGQILVNSNQAITDSQGRVVCVVSSTTVGESTFTAVVESQTLTSHPVVKFVAPSSTTTPEEPPPPTTSGPPPPPGPIEKIIEKITEAPHTIPPIIPGGIGLAILIPTIALLIPLGSSISIALLVGIPALQYLLLSSLPSLRPPRKWGVVKDSTTNSPIPGIFVDLMEAKHGAQIKRIMTDRTGRFGFLAPSEGKFWVEIKNALYEPYRTETFDVATFKNTAISFDIILVPLETARVEALRKTARYMRFLIAVQFVQLLLLIGGSVVSTIMFIGLQSLENSLLIILYSLLWVLRFVSSMSYQQSGHIVERSTDNAVHEAIIQVTSTRKGETEFVHSAITDERGRFLVLVPPGQYSVIAAKGGYKPVEKKISGEVQNLDVVMERSDLSIVSQSS